jgi:hypothetical protein
MDLLQAVDVVEALGEYGLGIWGLDGPINLNAIVGGHWETRQAFDVTVAMRTFATRPVGQIETATATIAIANHGSITVAATAP